MDIQLLKKLPLGKKGNKFINKPIEIIINENLFLDDELKYLHLNSLNIRKKIIYMYKLKPINPVSEII